jgi:DME family drug/metabolite transporter
MDTAAPPRAVRRGLLAVTTAAVLWGTVGVAGQLLADRTELPPLGVGFSRLAVAAVVMAGLRLTPGRSGVRVARRDLPPVLVVGAGLAAYQVCYFAAVRAVGVSVATLVTLGLAPVLVALGAALFHRERHGRAVLAALGLGLAGLGLLLGLPGGGVGGAAGGRAAVLGGLLAAGSATGYAGVTLVSRSLADRVDPRDLTLLGFAAGALALLPVAGPGLAGAALGVADLGLLLYLGAVPTALAYTLFFAGLRTTPSTAASILTLVEPLTATALAALLFGERLGPAGLLGGALLLGAVTLLAARR